MKINTICICIDWFYPAFKAGGPIVSIANLIENYHENVQYKIICSNEDLGGSILLNIEKDKWVEYNSFTHVFYCSKGKRSINKINALIKEIQPDVIYINGIFSLKFNINPLLINTRATKVLSPRGMLHPEALSQKKVKKSIFIFLLKYLVNFKKVIFHCTNEAEGAFTKHILGESIKLIIAGNFPRKIDNIVNLAKEAGELRLVTIALISPMKNYLEVLKGVKNCNMRIVYNIYGPVKEEDYWEDCLQIIKELPINIRVTYHGELTPLGVKEVLTENHVYIQPSKSENFGHSIYEALSAGLPVITSYGTPWNNLQTDTAGRNINPTNIDEITKAIDFFANLTSADFLLWQNGARLYAEKSINYNFIKSSYKKLFGF